MLKKLQHIMESKYNNIFLHSRYNVIKIKMSLKQLDQLITKALNASTPKHSGNLIQPIHPDVTIKYNSVNVIVGKQSSGKTVIALQEIIKLGILQTHHLFVYVTKEGKETDKTFINLKPLLLLPYVIVSEDEAVDYMKTLLSAKELYYTIRREHLEDKIEDEQKQDLFDVLHVDNFDNEYLHTVILFDDISNNRLFNSEESYFSQLIRRCRHVNISVFLLIQGWKGLKPHVKNEITTLFIFSCFNKQQLHFIYSQSASNLDFDEFYDMYREMVRCKNNNPDSYPYLVINVTEGGETSFHI